MTWFLWNVLPKYLLRATIQFYMPVLRLKNCNLCVQIFIENQLFLKSSEYDIFIETKSRTDSISISTEKILSSRYHSVFMWTELKKKFCVHIFFRKQNIIGTNRNMEKLLVQKDEITLLLWNALPKYHLKATIRSLSRFQG